METPQLTAFMTEVNRNLQAVDFPLHESVKLDSYHFEQMIKTAIMINRCDIVWSLYSKFPHLFTSGRGSFRWSVAYGDCHVMDYFMIAYPRICGSIFNYN